MASVYRTRAIWTGFVGAPGYTNMFWQTDDGTPPLSDDLLGIVRGFFFAIKAYLPADVSIQVQGDIAEIDVATAKQTGVLVGTTPAVVEGSDTGTYSAPTGLCVSWLTPAFLNGRGVRGRTYIVPLAGSNYDADGSLASTTITAFAAAGQTLITSTTASMMIYSRPTLKRPTGQTSGVDQVLVADKAAVLTSRRD